MPPLKEFVFTHKLYIGVTINVSVYGNVDDAKRLLSSLVMLPEDYTVKLKEL